MRNISTSKGLLLGLCLTAAGMTLYSGSLANVGASASAVAEAAVLVQAQSSDGGATDLKGRVPHPVTPNLPPIGADMAKERHLTSLLAQRTTNYNHASLSQTKNIELLAKRLNGVVVAPGAVFSYYRTVGPYNAENGYKWGRAFAGDRIVPSMGGGVCQGASTLYSALLRTGLPVVERFNHSLTVPYLPPGEDATVANTVKNFRFRNNRGTPVMIAATTDPAKRYLTVALWGAEPAPQISVKHDILQVTPYRVIRRATSALPAGQTKVLFPGQVGVRTRTWVEVKTDKGIVKHDVAVDSYRPSPRVIEVGRGK